MEEKATLVESLFEKTTSYIKTSIDLMMYKAVQKSTDLLSALAVRLVFVSVITLTVIMINIGLALWIGDLIGKSYYGFFIVALFYLLILLILYIFKDQFLKTPISNSIISQMLNGKSDKK